MDDLKAELIELAEIDVAIEDTAFTVVEFDQITISDEVEPVECGPLAPGCMTAVARKGDVYIFDGGRHRVTCGDATDAQVYRRLMGAELARFLFTDEPYNVRIGGHVTKGDHREFVMASGEMSDTEFLAFNNAWIGAAAEQLCDGGMIGTFIDWRGYPKVDAAALALGLTPINLIVWAKTNAGMGSLYLVAARAIPALQEGLGAARQQHRAGQEWPLAFKCLELSRRIERQLRQPKGLVLHPTVKPEAMCADSILDLTSRADIVLDPFLGAGSTLIAAQRTGRRCFGIELDPLYVDVAINRYQEVYGRPAILESTGETFEALAKRRNAEASEASEAE